MIVDPILSFWGKARAASEDGPRWHPLVWHLLDVAACAEALLAGRPLARRLLADRLGIEEADAVRLAVLIAALHDIGKFAASFQRKAEGPEWPFARARSSAFAASEHDRDGLALWHHCLGEEFGPRIWERAPAELHLLIGASVGHHGRALSLDSRDCDETFQPEGIVAARRCVAQLIDLLLPAPLVSRSASENSLSALSFWLAGFATVADWAGSGQVHFPYRAPDCAIAEYWEMARRQATAAVHALGLVPAARGSLKSFVALTGQLSPTPLQAFSETVDLGAGPVLIVIEDITGSGKTEAAQMLVHRLMSTDRAAGAYWAMPTQATANAMYERQSTVLSALFAEHSRPQLALAHGDARLHEGFQESILRGAAERDSDSGSGNSESDESASAACAAFLADDARIALIADVGAGTIDQAILGVLPARFQAVRLFGLSDKVLVIDEAHAYDAYMSEELGVLLQFHAALGGSAIVLSATLPRDVKHRAGREQLVRAWMTGCGARMKPWAGRSVVQDVSYPLMTVVSGASGIAEYPLKPAPWSCRSVPVRVVYRDEEVVTALVHAARRGAAVAWVRNTVDDALHAAAMVRSQGLEPITFHARFAQIDRQRIEASVMDRLGPRALPVARRGTVVIATQVIEQSLDLDFDLLASDLAPIDLLIQRAGRLRRHPHRNAIRPDVPFELIVRAPLFATDPAADWLSSSMRATSFVYRDPGVMWRTARLFGASGDRTCRMIRIPDDMRSFIEAVYALDAVVPAGLDNQVMRAEGTAKAHRGQAGQALLSVKQGYRADQMAWVSEDRLQVRTRAGTDQTTLRIARFDECGRLVPWAQVDALGWKQWALSEVKVASHRAPRGSKPLPRLERTALMARAAWGRRELERDDILLLPLELVAGRWLGTLVDPQGRERRFAYTQDVGLQFE